MPAKPDHSYLVIVPALLAAVGVGFATGWNMLYIILATLAGLIVGGLCYAATIQATGPLMSRARFDDLLRVLGLLCMAVYLIEKAVVYFAAVWVVIRHG